MTSILLALYGIYLVLVGVKGNAPQLFDMVKSEHQFLYWIIIMIVIALLWESDVAEEFAKSFAVLIVLGFLLVNNNYKKLGANLSAILIGTASGSAFGQAKSDTAASASQ